MHNIVRIRSNPSRHWPSHLFLFMVWGMLSAASALAGTVAQTPLFLTNAAKPVAMLNISKDHQLYFKAFDDFSDLDGDGLPDTTYKNSVEYYGYFDSYKCYNYNTTSKQFEPFSITTDKYCTGNWSGNFLNWSTMTRMDVVRKILYGGLRSTDTAASTVLERSHLPNDAHSIAKFYKGADLDKLTPYTLAATSGITLCSTTISAQYSQKVNTVTDPPKIRVAKGDYSLWSAGEAWQCRWLDEKNNGSNGNSTANKAFTEMTAGEFSPALAVKLDELVARVQVCASTAMVGQEQCKNYNGILKPIGLLQTYGDDGLIRFGLMTGSYAKNTTGGVLRKNVGLMTDEIDVSTGIFKTAPANGGIINTLNLLRIYGYNHNTGTYLDAIASGGDNCPFSLLTMFADGRCTNWGNPQAEILLESLRYLAGKAASTAFNVSDASYITGLPQVSWADPISPTEWCANINVIQFNASVTSFDADKLSTATELGIANLDAVTDDIGDSESIAGNPFFIGYLSGGTGTDINNLCTAKTISALSAARGVCPASPSLLGSYQAAGLAYGAKSASIRSDLKGSQTVTTYGVALAPYTPQVVVAVPNSSNTITILPACQNLRDGVNNSSRCGLVDFKIIYQNTPTTTATTTCPTVGANCGKFYVNWETAEQGGDFDMDMLGILSYEVKGDGTVKITTDVFKGSTGAAMGFGYIINGTTKDGFHAHSGYSGGTPAAGYIYVDPTGVTDCKTKCTDTDAATTASYTTGASTASILKQPLFYAAKWGGFIDSNGNNFPDLVAEWDTNTDGIPDRYFAATNPKQLAKSLGDAFADVLRTPSSASSVATNSTQFQSDTLIYQATFNSTDWSGHLLAYKLLTEDSNGNGKLDTGEDSNGNGKLDAGAIGPVQWDAGNTTKDLNGNGTIETGEAALIPSASNRHIYSYDPTKPDFKGIEFQWGAASTYLNDAQKTVLDSANLANTSSPILNYLRGDQSNEIKVSATGIYRTRSNLLGDIINSDPLFVGRDDQGYAVLPGIEGDSYPDFVGQARTDMLYVGANDGMLHGFNATTGAEVFAYLPDAVISTELASLASPTYTHKYFVDGSPQSGDVFYDNAWHTVLVETMGAGNTTAVGDAYGTGGHGLFALDITSPDSFASVSTGVANVLWEFTNRNNANLGYTLSKASIVRTSSGWVAVVSNGFDSSTGFASLFILDIKTGAVLQELIVDSSGSNGLASPVTVDVDNDLIVDYIYAGDLKGNLWKFDVTAGWAVANGGVPVFVAKDSSGVRQPITEKPAAIKASGNGQSTGVMVYFGTGKYFETGDNLVSSTSQVQSFYGIWDTCDKTNVGSCNGVVSGGRGDLQQQAIIYEGPSGYSTTLTNGTSVGINLRIVSNCDVSYDSFVPTTTGLPCTSNTNRRGWYLDLLQPSMGPQGEVSTSEPVLRNGLVIFATTIPLNETCTPGGTGWLMELEQSSGSRTSGTPFDVNGDGKIDSLDLATFSGDQVGASGMQSTVGIIKTPTIVKCEASMECKYMSGSSGALMLMKESATMITSTCTGTACPSDTNPLGRLHWRQLGL